MKRLICKLTGHRPLGQLYNVTSTIPLKPVLVGTTCGRCGKSVVLEAEVRVTGPRILRLVP